MKQEKVVQIVQTVAVLGAVAVGITALVFVVRFGKNAKEAFGNFVAQPLANAWVRLTAGPPIEVTERRFILPGGAIVTTAHLQSGQATLKFPASMPGYGLLTYAGKKYKIREGSADANGDFYAVPV